MTRKSSGTVGMSDDPGSASLRFVEPTVAAYLAAVTELADRGLKRVEIVGPSDESDALARALHSSRPDLQISEGHDATDQGARIRVFVDRDEERLSDRLAACIDDLSSAIVAPRTSRHWSCRPLFLISIPKAGTHLLYRLAAALGYRDGVICPDNPEPGAWYCLEGSNSHTSARDFLIERTKHSPFGNRAHPFFSSPALFIYRNPKDVLASEVNWFHRQGNSPLAGYLGALDDKTRVQRLLDDPWLLGSLRDRMGAFVPWLNFPNVASLAFEDLVGTKGDGDEARQIALVWSLQLKLHVDGIPSEIADQLYDRNSPTFAEGRIGAWRTRLPEDVQRQLAKSSDDLFSAFGYELVESEAGAEFPRRADEFRRRPLTVAPNEFFETPILVESAFLEANIVRFRGRYFGLSQRLGAINLMKLDADELAALPQSDSLAGLKAKMIIASSDTSQELDDIRISLASLLDSQLRRFATGIDAQETRSKVDGSSDPTQQLGYASMLTEAQMESFAAERLALAARLNAAEVARRAAERLAAGLQEKLNTMESRVNAAQAQAQAEIEQLRTQNSKHTDDVNQLVAPLRQLEFRVQAAESRAAELSQQRTILAEELRVAQRDNLVLVDSHGRLESALKERVTFLTLLRRLLRS